MSEAHSSKIEAYWGSFLESVGEDDTIPLTYEAWGFGDSPKMADSLGALVREGIKTATASLVWAYEAEDEALPEVGDYSIILDGHEEPLCIIQTTKVTIRPFNEVDAEHAYLEGEGDRSLAFWQDVHWKFFGRECAGLGREPSQEMPVLCERFKLVYL
jgi:uncharacterized protein YhfF